MDTKKKLLVSISIVSVMLILILTALTVVLVSGVASESESDVNINYTAQDVYCKVSANYITGGVSASFFDPHNNHAESITFDDYISNGCLSTGTQGYLQQIELIDGELVLEYKFENLSSEVKIALTLTSIPDIDNVSIGYVGSSSQLSVNSLTTSSSYSGKTIAENETYYLYIVLTAADSVEYNGSGFAFNLARG